MVSHKLPSLALPTTFLAQMEVEMSAQLMDPQSAMLNENTDQASPIQYDHEISF